MIVRSRLPLSATACAFSAAVRSSRSTIACLATPARGGTALPFACAVTNRIRLATATMPVAAVRVLCAVEVARRLPAVSTRADAVGAGDG